MYYINISLPDTQLGDCGYQKWENGLKAGLVTSLVAVGDTELDSIRALTKGYEHCDLLNRSGQL